MDLSICEEARKAAQKRDALFSERVKAFFESGKKLREAVCPASLKSSTLMVNLSNTVLDALNSLNEANDAAFKDQLETILCSNKGSPQCTALKETMSTATKWHKLLADQNFRKRAIKLEAEYDSLVEKTLGGLSPEAQKYVIKKMAICLLMTQRM